MLFMRIYNNQFLWIWEVQVERNPFKVLLLFLYWKGSLSIALNQLQGSEVRTLLGNWISDPVPPKPNLFGAMSIHDLSINFNVWFFLVMIEWHASSQGT